MDVTLAMHRRSSNEDIKDRSPRCEDQSPLKALRVVTDFPTVLRVLMLDSDPDGSSKESILV